MSRDHFEKSFEEAFRLAWDASERLWEAVGHVKEAEASDLVKALMQLRGEIHVKVLRPIYKKYPELVERYGFDDELKREALRLPVGLMLAMTLSSCASTASMTPPDEASALEWARGYAIAHCVSFFDGVVGEYEIRMVGNRVWYVGSMDMDSFSPDLRVEMGFDGRLISIASGNAGVFPPDALNQGLKERRCGSFHDFHDGMGRPVKAEWKPYQR